MTKRPPPVQKPPLPESRRKGIGPPNRVSDRAGPLERDRHVRSIGARRRCVDGRWGPGLLQALANEIPRLAVEIDRRCLRTGRAGRHRNKQTHHREGASASNGTGHGLWRLNLYTSTVGLRASAGLNIQNNLQHITVLDPRSIRAPRRRRRCWRRIVADGAGNLARGIRVGSTCSTTREPAAGGQSGWAAAAHRVIAEQTPATDARRQRRVPRSQKRARALGTALRKKCDGM